jgi:hypothetical protein
MTSPPVPPLARPSDAPTATPPTKPGFLSSRMRRVVTALALVVAFVVGVWFGEEGAHPTIASVGTAVLLTGGAAAMGRRAVSRALVFTATLGIYALAFYLGAREVGRAYNECVEPAELVRASLAAYSRATGAYPASLAELGIRIPCRRMLRGSLLGYQRTERGYDLWFSDWLVSHEASEAHGFGAHK